MKWLDFGARCLATDIGRWLQVYHAYQYLQGDVLKEQNANGTYGLKPRKGLTAVALEVDAKIAVANMGMGYIATTQLEQGYSVDTMLGLIKAAKGNRQAVVMLLIKGTSRTYFRNDGATGSLIVNYTASYYTYLGNTKE
ncbi:MAG: hypothetical protein HC892_19725 [Saprospiraceae bacterium]|nr:hypothetical protein [Saprospiraceae bacterium]